MILVPSLMLAELVSNAAGAPPQPHGAIPDARQLAWHEHQFYAFVHFNMNTFTGIEWGHGTESPKKFNPTELDCMQWCALFKECGLTGVILTAKHHDGFCLWPSQFTEHDIENSPWKNGKGDVVKELAEACKHHGLWLGIYISPWDRNNPIYGKDDAAYNDYYVGQMEELFTNYGPIAEVWWDGANGDLGNPEKHQEYDWDRYIKTVRRLQPDAVIFAPPYSPGDTRWVGNERGYAAATQWSTYPANTPENASLLNTGVEGADSWMPSETDVSLRPGWYWTAETDDKVKSADKLLDIYYNSVGHNSNLLLNFPVDSRGLVHENDAAALRKMTATLKETFSKDLAQGQSATATESRGSEYSAASLTDGDPSTYWAAPDGVVTAKIEIDLAKPSAVNRIALQEHVELGQRVRKWHIEARVEGEWRQVCEGTTIGHLRLARFATVNTDKLRLSILDSRACPTIESFRAYLSPDKL